MITETENKINTTRAVSLAGAEAVDAWRVVPRLALAGYISLIAYIVAWFVGIETHPQFECSQVILESLLDRSVPLADAKAVACTIVGVVGGPQTAHTVLATVITGLATAIFGLYTSTGRDWSKSMEPWRYGQVSVKTPVDESGVSVDESAGK